jgi:hypothetical protein
MSGQRKCVSGDGLVQLALAKSNACGKKQGDEHEDRVRRLEFVIDLNSDGS